uniref:Insulin-degrading enzyme n=1 Tax=Steinernema glaseri TaxID=37863 RepID=A0A1I7YS86_9BILA
MTFFVSNPFSSSVIPIEMLGKANLAENSVAKLTTEPSDKELFRSVQLSNGLKIRLFSNQRLRDASANLDVDVGTVDDPDELPGLAHFCEHLLLMGNKKYPEEHGLNIFLAHNNGYNNASTGSMCTSYFFRTAERFEEALDRLAHMFLSPLFTQGAVEREVNALDCEFRDRRDNDWRREIFLVRTLYPPGHWARKICGGNRQTLLEIPASKGINVCDEVARFFEKHYSANLMTLTMCGKQSLDELEEMVRKLPFHKIRNSNIPPRVRTSVPHYAPENCGCRFDIVPVQLIRRLSIWFDLNHNYYFGKLVAHGAKGSLAYELKHRGWASLVRSRSKFSNQGVIIDLSQEGLKHVEDILELLFLYIGMLAREGPQMWFYEELCAMSEIRNRFNPEQESAENKETVNHAFDKVWIKLVPMLITPRKMVYFVSTKKNVSLDELERDEYSGVQYKRTEPCEELLKRLEKALETESGVFFLPPRNEYIPAKFDLKPRDEEGRQLCFLRSGNDSFVGAHPRVIAEDQFQRIWYLQDNRFKQPWVEVQALFNVPISGVNALSLCMTWLFEQCFWHHSRSEFFNAQQAGFKFELTGNRRGIYLHISGYDDMMGHLVSKYFNALMSYKPDKITFDQMLEELITDYENIPYQEPLTQAAFILDAVLSEGQWSAEEMLKAFGSVTFEAFLEFIQRMWSARHLEIFFYGNLTQEEALTWGRICSEDRASVRPLSSEELKPLRMARLPEGKTYFHEVNQETHSNGAVLFFLQTGAHEPRNNILTKLLLRLIEKPAFNALRTNEQLGYIVQSARKTFNGAHGLIIKVQGSYDPAYVEQRIETFLENFKLPKPQERPGAKKECQFTVCHCFEVRLTMEGIRDVRDQSHHDKSCSYDVTEALEEAREILTQGQARKHSHEHVLEDATTVKVMKSGTNAEPIEVVVSRRTVVSQPNSEDEEEYGGYGSGSDVDVLVRSRTSSCIHHRHDGHFEGTGTRHTNVRYRRKKGDSWQRDVGGEVDNADEAHLEVDVKSECVENDEGSRVVKTWEARWTVQHFDLLPEWLQDNEFLRHGHRPPLPSYAECFKSIWALHTETGNIWTHLIGCVAFFCLALWFLTRPDTHIQLQEKLVFSAFFVGAILCLGMSFTFHTVSCHSVDVVRMFSKLDYAGISLLIIGSFIPWIYYGFYCRMEPKITYIAMVCVLGVVAIIVSSWDKFSESQYRPLRALVFVAMGGSGVIPALHFAWKEGADLFVQGGFHWLLIMALLYLLGALLYATRTPERFFPGKFDIWFQSHQLFHICVVCAALVHYCGITELAFNRLTGTCDADTGEMLTGISSEK